MGTPNGDEEQEDCKTCGGAGYICQTCNKAAGDCICTDDDEPEEVECPDCSSAT